MRSFIPGQEQPPQAARPKSAPRYDLGIICELCGEELPDSYADDTFPMCGSCIEGLLEAGARDTL